MPKSSSDHLSTQLNAYREEPRDRGSVAPITATTKGAEEKKEAEMKGYLTAWDENWKYLEATRCVQSRSEIMSPIDP